MNRPTTIQSQPEAARFEAQFTGPRRDVLRFIAKFNHVGVAFFFSLLKGCFPSAIVLGVRKRPVFPANGMSARGFWSHVFQELGKSFRASPSVAYGYPAASVVFVAGVAFAIASALHCLPTPEPFGADELPVITQNAIRISPRNTPTGFGVLGAEVHCENVDKVSAITSASPSCLSAGTALGSSDYGKAIILFSNEIEKRRHSVLGLWLRNPVESQIMYHVNT